VILLGQNVDRGHATRRVHIYFRYIWYGKQL